MALDPLTAGMELGGQVVGLIKRWFPEKMSEQQEAQLEEMANASFRDFVVRYEGAAKDYKDIPFVGPLVLLFRGLIRPVFTLAVMYGDFMYFKPSADWSAEQSDLLWLINLLVVGFWFGERAVKNSGAAEILKSWLGSKK